MTNNGYGISTPASTQHGELHVKALCEFLAARVAKWWIPERWCFLEEVPKTSVGKFDKKVLRAQFAS